MPPGLSTRFLAQAHERQGALAGEECQLPESVNLVSERLDDFGVNGKAESTTDG